MSAESKVELRLAENQPYDNFRSFDNRPETIEETNRVYMPISRWEELDSPEWITQTLTAGRMVKEGDDDNG